MARLEIELIPLLSDNYAFLLREPTSGAVAVIDPAVAEPVMERLGGAEARLDLVLATHHHSDHVAGIPAVKSATGARVVGPAADAHRIPGMDEGVREGDTVRLGELTLQVMETPGHTTGHVTFWAPDAEAVFCGDTMFVMGCGRLLEDTAEAMWHSLERLGSLPDATRVYCGHEYTMANARFALHVDSDNQALLARAAEVEDLRAGGQPTVPTTIAREKATNPFLRSGNAARFAELRRQKDRF